MGAIASQITSLAIVYLTVYSGWENIKAPRHWPLWGEITGPGEFPAQMASNAVNVSLDDVIISKHIDDARVWILFSWKTMTR